MDIDIFRTILCIINSIPNHKILRYTSNKMFRICMLKTIMLMKEIKGGLNIGGDKLWS